MATMAGIPDAGTGRGAAGTTKARARWLFNLLTLAAQGRTTARQSLREELQCESNCSGTLLEVAVHAGGCAASRALCDQYLADDWSQQVPLHLQEYSPVLGADPHFHLSISEAYATSSWGPRHIRALEATGPAGIEAARRLRQDLDIVAAEASAYAVQLAVLRLQTHWPSHAARVQALARVEAAFASLRGVRVLEIRVGEERTLGEHLMSQGAHVAWFDVARFRLASRMRALRELASSSTGAFGLLVATSVFESESGWRRRSGSPATAWLSSISRLLAPRGIAVFENACEALPFTLDEARLAGFSLMVQRVPGITLASGGRACTLLRQ